MLGLEFIRNHAASKSQRCLHKLSNCLGPSMFAQDLTAMHKAGERGDIAAEIWPEIGLPICVVRACALRRSANGCASMH